MDTEVWKLFFALPSLHSPLTIIDRNDISGSRRKATTVLSGSIDSDASYADSNVLTPT